MCRDTKAANASSELPWAYLMSSAISSVIILPINLRCRTKRDIFFRSLTKPDPNYRHQVRAPGPSGLVEAMRCLLPPIADHPVVPVGILGIQAGDVAL